MLLDGNVPAPGRRRACVDYEFPQERADIDHTTVSWKFPDELWDEVQRSHGHAADIMMLWVVFAGIQTALRGGTIQMPCFVRTVITPLDAKTS